MKKDRKNLVVVMTVGALLLAGLIACLAHRPQELSVSERRRLNQAPALTWKALAEGSFWTDFESYAVDQFPLRMPLRTLKAAIHFGVLWQSDNNGIYLINGSVSKLDSRLHTDQVSSAAAKFTALYDAYLADTDCRVYLAAVPDKNYYLATENGYPALDYDALLSVLYKGTPAFTPISLLDCLSAEDYYSTDPHWRQERLSRVLTRLGEAMEVTFDGTDGYDATSFAPFYGAYYGQSALPLAPDTLYYLGASRMQAVTVKNYETGKTGAIYNTEKLTGLDAYDVFLSGACPLMTVENPDAATERELVLFRDSFGSSIAPMMLSGYRRITLIDTRYMDPSLIPSFVTFTDQDVLFLYSTTILNNSSAIR